MMLPGDIWHVDYLCRCHELLHRWNEVLCRNQEIISWEQGNWVLSTTHHVVDETTSSSRSHNVISLSNDIISRGHGINKVMHICHIYRGHSLVMSFSRHKLRRAHCIVYRGHDINKIMQMSHLCHRSFLPRATPNPKLLRSEPVWWEITAEEYAVIRFLKNCALLWLEGLKRGDMPVFSSENMENMTGFVSF